MGMFSDFVGGVVRITKAVVTGGASELDRLGPGDPARPPRNPATSPKAIEERDRKAREEQLRLLMGGRESTIQTSPLGLSTAAPIATKSLLGS